MLANRRSTFGITCVQCHEELIAPDKSEYRASTHIRHLWHCSNCSARFEINRADSCRGDDGGRYSAITTRGLVQFGRGEKGGLRALLPRRPSHPLNQNHAALDVEPIVFELNFPASVVCSISDIMRIAGLALRFPQLHREPRVGVYGERRIGSLTYKEIILSQSVAFGWTLPFTIAHTKNPSIIPGYLQLALIQKR